MVNQIKRVMKELSIEEKAKAYDEAIKVAKSNYDTIVQMDNDCTFAKEGIVNTFHHMFPELKETEDERIKKEITELVMQPTWKTEKEFHRRNELCAWLEKQGEQKSNDKVEPKLKIEKDNWYFCIRDLDDDYGTRAFRKGGIYYSTKDETLMPDNSNIPYEIKYCVWDYFRPWDIQDAKDGDVLVASDDSIFLFKGMIDSACKHYVALTTNNVVEFNEGLEHYWETSRAVHPATKEQRDTLMKAITEAGYEWNAEKKEVKKIKQTPNNNQFTPEQARVLDKHIDKFVKQKPAWSEEDEKIRKGLIGHLRECRNNTRSEVMLDEYAKWISWLEKQGKVKDSTISQHENETCKENGNSLTSEDIRKGLIQYFSTFTLNTFAGIDPKKILAWLEEQSEQKSTVIIPKFKIGDIIEYVGERKELIDGKYEIQEIGNDFYVTTCGAIIPFKFEEYYINKTKPKFKVGDLVKDTNHTKQPIYKVNYIDKECYVCTSDDVTLGDKAVMHFAFDNPYLRLVEQNPVDKVEPKFKVGDWVTNSIETVQITGYDIDYGYQVDYKGNLQHRDTDIIEKEYHLWTIQDAKDGNILACNNDILSICIFSHFDGINNKYDSFLCHCGLEGEGLGQELNINGYHDDSTGYVPATKEQREQLEKAMADAGYTFDFEKKELKKINLYCQKKLKKS